MNRILAVWSVFFLLSCQTAFKKDTPISQKAVYYVQIVRGHLINCLYPQALVEMKKAFFLEPDHYIINDKLGAVYFFMKQYDQAEFYFSKALSLKPRYTEARVNLAHTLIKKRKWDQALLHLKKAEEDLTYGNPSEVYFAAGEVYYHQKKYNLAQKYLKSALDVNFKNCFVSFYLGRIDFDQKKYKSAIQKFKQMNQCRKKTRQNQTCRDRSIVDQYYFQGVSEIKIKNKKNGVRSLNLFIKKAKSDNILLDRAKNLLKRAKSL